VKVPLIGVTPHWDEYKDILRTPTKYMDGIMLAGGMPVMLPLTPSMSKIEQIMAAVDGILLTGGDDVAPGLYGERAEPFCGPICKERDEMEVLLVYEAVYNLNKPILGICRGLQVINVALGGTLYQDLPSQFKKTPPSERQDEDIIVIRHQQGPPHNVPSHCVDFIKDSPLKTLLGDSNIMVNSSHHQGIRVLSKELKGMAIADDGLIEAVYMPEMKYLWAVQWHPELTLHDINSRLLFDAFVEACR